MDVSQSCCCGRGVAWGSLCSRCPEENSDDYRYLCSKDIKLKVKEPIVEVSKDEHYQPPSLGKINSFMVAVELHENLLT